MRRSPRQTLKVSSKVSLTVQVRCEEYSMLPSVNHSLIVIKHVVDDNIYLPFGNTAHACTSAWCAQHCSTAAVQIYTVCRKNTEQLALRVKHCHYIFLFVISLSVLNSEPQQ